MGIKKYLTQLFCKHKCSGKDVNPKEENHWVCYRCGKDLGEIECIEFRGPYLYINSYKLMSTKMYSKQLDAAERLSELLDLKPWCGGD
jgi:hypothetical protein